MAADIRAPRCVPWTAANPSAVDAPVAIFHPVDEPPCPIQAPALERSVFAYGYPDLLLCGDVPPKFPFQDKLCLFVRRGSAGQTLFEFWHPERRLELFPQGGQPQSFVEVFDVSHQLLGRGVSARWLISPGTRSLGGRSAMTSIRQ